MKNIIENNKLIAEFMGLDWDEVVEQCKSNLYESGYRDNLIINNPEYWVCYNSSWDWIMPIVGKIESLENNLSEETIEDFRQFQKVLSLPIYSKIGAVYSVCVEFIKCYNSKK